MRPLLVALTGVILIGLVGGDPRAAHDLSRPSYILVAGLALALGVGTFAWYRGARRSFWLLAPSVLLAVMGGLSGWIAGAEFTGHPDSAAHLAGTPGRVAFMIVMTTAGMSLPSVALARLAGRARPPGTART